MGRGPLFLAGLFALLVPGAANGATVAVETEVSGGNKGPDIVRHTLKFKAAAGETNAVRITIGTTVIVRDDGASVAAGSGCTQAGPNEVTCAGVDSGTVTLDDGNDRVEVAGAFKDPAVFTLAGGDGNDSIYGGSGAETLIGGAGDDVVDAGAGNDTILGGGGRDTMRGGAGDDSLTDNDGELLPGSTGASRLPAAVDGDVLDGGRGLDRADYRLRTAGLTIDLGNPAAPAGEPGEGDALAGFEQLATGSGDDTLTGSDGADEIDAGPGANNVRLAGGNDTGSGSGMIDGDAGDDRLSCDSAVSPCTAEGGAGNDVLTGGSQTDLLSGGAGDDRLQGSTGADRLLGGDGNDRLFGDEDAFVNEDDGDDVLDGGAGADLLYGAGGADVLTGGTGRNRIEAADGQRDQVNCGGRGSFVRRDRRDRVSSCSRVTSAFRPPLGPDDGVLLGGDPVLFVSCPAFSPGCRGTVDVFAPDGRRIARGRASGDDELLIFLSLSRAEARKFRRTHRFRGRVVLRMTVLGVTTRAARTLVFRSSGN